MERKVGKRYIDRERVNWRTEEIENKDIEEE